MSSKCVDYQLIYYHIFFRNLFYIETNEHFGNKMGTPVDEKMEINSVTEKLEEDTERKILIEPNTPQINDETNSNVVKYDSDNTSSKLFSSSSKSKTSIEPAVGQVDEDINHDGKTDTSTSILIEAGGII